jgi:hypothetical protein
MKIAYTISNILKASLGKAGRSLQYTQEKSAKGSAGICERLGRNVLMLGKNAPKVLQLEV